LEAVNTERVTVASLFFDPANVRKHGSRNLDAIKSSLARFGQQKPIVVDADGIVRAGNGTLMAAKALGWDEIEIVRTNLRGSEATAYAIADNRTAELAEWDEGALAEQLAALQIDDETLAAATGFDASEIERIALPVDVVEDEVPEVPVEPITKPGDLWLLGEHRVLCGDSTKAEDVARLMDGAKADLCFTSPPYNLGKSVGLRNGARSGASTAYDDNQDDDIDEWQDLMIGFLAEALPISTVVAINVQMLAGNKILLLSLLGRFATNTIDLAVWCKSNPQPAMAERVMNSAFEFVWLLSNEHRPSRAIPTAVFDRGTFDNVLESGTASGHDASIHGAVFPLAVATRFVGSFCGSQCRVYDPFLGSGTTLIAAEQLGRKCYGMEISPAYCDVIVKRWETLTGKKATLAA
jgi:hypothetical protein